MTTDKLPKGWCMVTAADVGSIQLGRQRSPKNHTGPHMKRYLRVANVFEDRIDASDLMEMNFEPEEFERYRLLPGDVLLNEGQSPELLGRPAIYRGTPEDVAFTNSLIRFQAHEGVLPEWALTVFRHHMHSGRFSKESRITTNIAHLSAKRFATTEFPVPPTVEQARIVAELDRRLTHVAAAERGLRTALSKLRLARAATLDAFTSGDRGRTVSAPAGDKYLEALLRERADDDRFLGRPRTQAGWLRLPLAILLDRIEAGKSYACDGRPAQPGEWGVVKVSAMSSGRFLADENKALPAGVEPPAAYLIRAGDLLLSRANTSELVGANVLVGAVPDRLVLSDKSLRLVPHASVNRAWLHAALSAPRTRQAISTLATGTKESMRNISQAKLLTVELAVPPPEVQEAAVSEVERRMSLLDRSASDIEQQLVYLRQLHRSVLAAAFSGQLVPQDPTDEPAEVLLERIRASRAAAAPTKKTRTRRNKEAVA